MSKPAIHWRLMFRVNNRPALDRCLGRTLPLIGEGVEVVECMPYWKIPELWECDVVSPLPDGSAAEHVLACLLAAKRLAVGWLITGSLSTKTAEGFGGVFDAKSHGSPAGAAMGLEWASFRITAPG